MEKKMESRMTMMIVSASLLSVALSLPASAGEKVSGHNSNFQILSEVTATIPDRSGHILRQRTLTYTATTNSARIGDFWVSEISQAEVIGQDVTIRAYGTDHFANGDVAYYSLEGTSKVTPKGPGAFESVSQGKFVWTGGTGKHDVKGPGTYTCTFTQSGGNCDWQGEAEFSGM
jgi:hypothetical protein